MSDFYTYGVADHLYKPMPKQGTTDFANSADWTPAAGDVKISKDGGAAANVTNLPTALVMGNVSLWDFSLTATEMQARKIRITVGDTATKAVQDNAFEIDTLGNASAQWPGFPSDLRLVNADATVAVKQQRMLNAVTVGTVTNAGSAPTLTQFECSDITEATANAFVNLEVRAATGLLAGQILGYVTAYALVAGRGRFTISPGSPSVEILANGDIVVIL